MKPFEIRRIGSRIVEVVSYPTTPSRGVLVRMIPGDPTSAKWVPEKDLKECILTGYVGKLYIHFATVKGKKLFPMDMLRYDCCSTVKESFGSRDEELVIYRVCNNQKVTWHNARWESFGWKLTVGQHMLLERK